MSCSRWLLGATCALITSPLWAVPPGAPAQGVDVYSAREIKRDVSRPMRDIVAEMGPARVAEPGEDVIPNEIRSFAELYPALDFGPGELMPAQRSPNGLTTPSPTLTVNGISTAGSVPPDTTGDAGPNHYFQWVNTRWALFDKTTGAMVSGPTAGSSFFSGFGGVCQTTNRGDPLVLFDDIAQRWVVSQFAFNSTSTAPFVQCVAVSTTADPLGTYNRYAFQYPQFNDYGKMGVWVTNDGTQNAYLFTMHEFNSALSFQGTSFALVERDKVLAGQSAQFVRVGGINAFGALPMHLEGVNPMPDRACPVFVHFSATGTGYRLWDMCVDWGNGSTSFTDTPTFVGTGSFALGLNGIPQLSSVQRLDDFGGNLMYLAAIRAFGANGPSEAKAVITHSVNVGNDQAATRWVEFGLSDPQPFAPPLLDLFADGFEGAAPPSIEGGNGPVKLAKRLVDEGTFAPDQTSRWMGGINIDANGNIGLGYNASSAAINPQVRLTGRERNDPAGTMRNEVTATPPNTGAQTGSFGNPPRPRWGDYATMGVDPVDQCTFWFTNEYYPVTSNSSWSTRIAKFKFPSCGQPDFELETQPQTRIQACGTAGDQPTLVRVGAYGTLAANVNLSATGLPGGVTASFSPNSLPAGGVANWMLNGASGIAPGAYTVTLSGTSGALTRTRQLGLDVSAALSAAPTLNLPGAGATNVVVRPTLQWAASAGATRYEIDIASDAAFTNIVDSGTTTGTSYSSGVLLNVGQTYHWRVRGVNACGVGLNSATRSFTTGAPGTCPSGTTANTVFSDDVSGDGTAWVVTNISGDAGALWAKTTPPAGTGLATRAWYAQNSASTADQRLTSPTIVLPAISQSPIVLGFDAFHAYETDGASDCWDGGFVEISTNGGASFTPLGNARNLADAYPGVLSSGNPAQGSQAWCRQPTPGASVRTYFLLDGFAGQSVQLRFRSTADSNTTGAAPNGWAIDNIAVQGCQ
ncbi:MAG: hypothetical protein AB7E72_05570 [Lysobacterales bacterium]